MRTILGLVLLFSFISLNIADDYWYRVANHLGSEAPAAIKFKTCSLPNVYVNSKSSGKIGFGHDIPTSTNPSGSMCSSNCASKRSDVRDDGIDENPDALYAADSAVNFNVYWSSATEEPNRILTRVANGDIAYQMGPDTSLSVASTSASDQYVTVGSQSVRRYPPASFQFLDQDRIVTQNWYFEQADSTFACSSSGSTPNDFVQTFKFDGIQNSNIGSFSFKSRVLFNFASEQTPSGKVSVQVVWNSDNQNFEKHIRSTDGATFDHPWISGITVRVTTIIAGATVTVFDENTIPVSEYSQQCSNSELDPIALKRNVPLVSSS